MKSANLDNKSTIALFIMFAASKGLCPKTQLNAKHSAWSQTMLLNQLGQNTPSRMPDSELENKDINLISMRYCPLGFQSFSTPF